MSPKAQPFNPAVRYSGLPLLPPRQDVENHAILKACIEAGRELVELVFVQPYCRIANVVEAGLAKRQTASEYLKELSDIGVLNEVKVGREKLFIHPKLMALLKSEQHVFSRYKS